MRGRTSIALLWGGLAYFSFQALDKCGPRKILRFRCDTNGEPYWANGLLGVMDCDRQDLSEFNEDHAAVATRRLDNLLLRFCTPLAKNGLPSAPDRDLHQHILKSVRVFAADGAPDERRSLFLAAETLFKSCILLLRDPAHIIRIAMKTPLHVDSAFGEVWTELFDKRHALVPDLQYSDKWKNLLRAIQKDVLSIRRESQPLACVLRHLAFAKQRFDSTADPQGKLSLMLLSVCTLLAFVASDERNKKDQRDRAISTIRKFTPKFCMALGVSADWGLVSQAFLRLFDQTDHDIALTRSEIDDFLETLNVLFIKGYVFTRPSGLPLAMNSSLPAPLTKVKSADGPAFMTELVEKQIRKECVFRAGTVPVLCWGRCSSGDLKDLGSRIHNVAKVVEARIRAEFGNDDMRSWLQCFDCRKARFAFSAPRGSSDAVDNMRKRVLHGITAVAAALGLDRAMAALEYRDMVEGFIIATTKEGQPLAAADNRIVWGSMLSKTKRSSVFPSRAAPFRVMPKLVRFYIAIQDGECEVERLLGTLRAECEAHHHNADTTLLDDKMIARMCGPKAAAEVVSAVGDDSLRLASFGRECAALWREIYGARLGCYDSKRDGKKLAKKKGTWISRKRGVLQAEGGKGRKGREGKGRKGREGKEGKGQAAGCAVASSRAVAITNADPDTPFGVRRSFFESAVGDGAGTTTSRHWNPKFERFQKLTAKKKVQNHLLLQGRRGNFPKFKPRLAAQSCPQLPAVSRISFVGNCQDPTASAACTIMSGSNRCSRSNLVVVSDMAVLHRPACARSLADVIYIAGLGLPVITEASWMLAAKIPHKLSRESVIQHAALARDTAVIFRLSQNFRLRYPSLADALAHCADKGGVGKTASKWKVIKKDADAVRGGVAVVDLDGDFLPLAEWILKHRRVSNTLGPKVLSAPSQLCLPIPT